MDNARHPGAFRSKDDVASRCRFQAQIAADFVQFVAGEQDDLALPYGGVFATFHLYEATALNDEVKAHEA